MQRYLFYLSITLLTLTLGITSTCVSYQENRAASQLKAQSQNENIFAGTTNNQFVEEQPEKLSETVRTIFTCEHILIKPVWEKMRMSESFKAYAEFEYSRIDRVDCAENFNAKLVDINGDGVNEIAVQGKWGKAFCGLNSGCCFWLFKKDKSKYETILSFGDTFNYEIGEKSRLGFRDIILSERHSWGYNRYFYQYDGKKYKAKKCYLYSFDYPNKNEKLQKGKNLIISEDDCPQEEN